MKKLVGLLLICVLAVFLTACGNDAVKIDEFEWKLISATKLDAQNTGISVGDVVLVAENGVLTLRDNTNSEIYNGAYEEMVVTENPDDYKIFLDGKEGYVTITEEQNLIMTVDGYDLYFSAK